MDHEQAIRDLGDVERKVRELICKVYECDFAGPIKVIPLRHMGYQVKFGFPHIERPVSIAAELPDLLFFKYVEDELRFGRWHTVESWRQELTYDKKI